MLLATMLPQLEVPIQLTFFVTNLDCFGDFFRGLWLQQVKWLSS
jgi:hypothetical protein